MTKDNDVRLNIRLKPHEHAWLLAAADKRGQTVAKYVRLALRMPTLPAAENKSHLPIDCDAL